MELGLKFKRRLIISFSGGRTSAFMLWLLWNYYQEEYDIKVVFANTGKEAEGTLEFVNKISTEWNIPIEWVEYTPTNKTGWRVKAKIVSFETASRKGEPFEAMIKLVGIPSTNAPFCSTLLKNRTIKAYARSIRWKKYYVAIGIRSDEIDRVNPKWKQERIIYPFITDLPTIKQFILDWFGYNSFNLLIDPDEGNCDCCWKKDMLRLVRIARKKPSLFVWWDRMSEMYGFLMPRVNVKIKPPFNFFRGNKSPKDILEMAKMPDDEILEVAEEEKLNSCSESCEAF